MCARHALGTQLCVDGLQVADGVHRPVHVHDFFVLEAPHHVVNAVNGLNVGQEGVAKAGTVGGAGDEASNVRDGEHRRDFAAGFVRRAQGVKPGVLGKHTRGRASDTAIHNSAKRTHTHRHRDTGDVRLDGAKRAVLHGDVQLGQGVEKRRLAAATNGRVRATSGRQTRRQ